MAQIKRKTVRFCPLCASPTSPDGRTPYSVCEKCDLEFIVNKKKEPPRPQVNGKTHQSECGSKIRHASVAEAYARSLDLPDIPNRARSHVQFYQCRWCEKIHIGHGGKHKKNSTICYSNEQARDLYEQAVEDKGLTPSLEDFH